MIRDSGLLKGSAASSLAKLHVELEPSRELPALEHLWNAVLQSQQRIDASADDLASDRLRQLEQFSDEVWQADTRLAPLWISPAGQPYRPWISLVTVLGRMPSRAPTG